MDWNELEYWLLNELWGVYTFMIIGGLSVWLILNILGRLNKEVKWLWTFYKEGRKKSVDLMSISDNWLDYRKWNIVYVGFAYFSLLIYTLISINQDNSEAMKVIQEVFIVLGSLSMIYLFVQINSIMKFYNKRASKDFGNLERPKD